jgi:hypothetical protein
LPRDGNRDAITWAGAAVADLLNSSEKARTGRLMLPNPVADMHVPVVVRL